MVRIVSQNFSPPRSRHSSGETDLDLAERTRSALSVLGGRSKRVETPDCESSSDSFWDSEFDCEQLDTHLSEVDSEQADINGNDPSEKSDPQSKRRQRRRERNKISAQAYRQRRRHQNVKEQQQLVTLEVENKRLHKMVESLEKKTEQAKQYLRGISVPMPDILSPVGEEGPSEGFEDQPCEAGAAASSLLNTKPNSNDTPIAPEPRLSGACFPGPDYQAFHSLPISCHQLSSQNNNLMQPENQANNPHQPPVQNPSPVTHTQGLPLQPQFLINAQTLITSPPVSSNENINGATLTSELPSGTYLAVPIEHAAATQCLQQANLNIISNINHGFSTLAPPVNNGDPAESKWVPATNVIGAPTTPVQSLPWNGQNANAAPRNSNTVLSIVKMEMCNRGNINITSNQNANVGNMNVDLLNDSNGNANSPNTMTMKAINPHIVSFKINLNQASNSNGFQGNVNEIGFASQATLDQGMQLHVQ